MSYRNKHNHAGRRRRNQKINRMIVDILILTKCFTRVSIFDLME